MSGWPEPVERVAAALRRSGIEAQIEALVASEPTVAEVATILGVSSSEIVETVVFLCDERPVAALVPGDRRASPEKIARAAESSWARLADAAEVLAISGFDPRALPPLPLPSHVLVFIDSSLLAKWRVWANAGSPGHLLGCAPIDLVTLTGAEILDVTGPYG